ncbi:MAG: DUF2141 domain-containing protein [Flavobacteriales bacterium]|jgi:uncharacterized protein (DUF2141 family)|nr:DUF2141 domain-containing protein [Flavobacteriales bacterium]
MNRHTIILILLFLTSVTTYSQGRTTLTIEVTDLHNNNGVVQFSLYNTNNSIPDEHYEKYYKQTISTITNNSSKTTFKNLPEGEYAVNILHDEDSDGKIKKGWILPIEGIGFSNLTKINLLNLPSFKKTKFKLTENKEIKIKIIYL